MILKKMKDIKKIVIKEAEYPENCSGCRLCENVCSFVHEGAFAPWLSRITVEEENFRSSTPHLCRLCDSPSCVASCAQNALCQSGTMLISIDKEKCTGCGECVTACPFEAMSFDEDKNVPLVCDYCGGEPECVNICPMGVLSLDDK